MLTGTGRQHVHPGADEEFTVVRGKLSVILNGLAGALEPGAKSERLARHATLFPERTSRRDAAYGAI